MTAGRADADAARDHRRILVEGDRVLVDRDAGLAERGFGGLAGDALREDVDEHQVVVGAAADQPEARGGQRRGQPRGVGDDLPLIGGERRLRGFLEADGLGRDDVHQRSALHAGEHAAIEILRVPFPAQHHAAARSAQRLVGGRRDEVGVRNRARMDAGGDEAGDVRHVGEDDRRRPASAIARIRAKSMTRG